MVTAAMFDVQSPIRPMNVTPGAHPLQRFRESARLSQSALAALIGVSTATVSRWEKGKRIPEPAYWARIKAVTGGVVTINDFTPNDGAAA